MRRARLLFAVVVAIAAVAASCGGEEKPSFDSADAPEPTDPLGPTEPPDPDETDEPPETVESGKLVEPLPFHVEGHRGARGLKPESTLPSFETALDIGVTTLELDLHLTADGEVVVWHDNTLGADKCRFADGTDFPSQGVAIVELTVDQLDDYQCDLNPDAGRFPDQDNGPTQLAGADYAPVTLGALFDFVATYSESSDKTDEQRARAATVEFNVETKRDADDPTGIGDDFDGVNPGQFELALLAAIDQAETADRVVIQSFDHRSLWAIRSINEDVRLAALTSLGSPDLADYAARGAAIWSPNFLAMTAELVDEAHAEGLLVIPWTVNSADDMLSVLDRGADGLITDRPDIAAALR